MAVVMIDGFDKYKQIAGALFGGDWNTVWNNNVADGYTGSFAHGIYQGDAFRCGQDSGLYKALPGNYPTIIWGLRFYVPGPSLNCFCVIVGDGTTNQVTVRTTDSGFIQVNRGSQGGPVFGLQGSTTLATSTANISINTWHYLEAKIGIDTAAGFFDVYLDGTLIISETAQNTQVTSHAYTNSFVFTTCDFQSNCLVDDLYVFDTSGSFCNDIIGDSVVETQFPNGDSLKQFDVGASAFGDPYSYGGGSDQHGGNVIVLRQFLPPEDCIINSVSVRPASTSVTVKYAMVIYEDVAGAPGNLMSDGIEIIGATTDVVLTGALSAPQNLVANTPYWIGFITDTNVYLYKSDNLHLFGFQGSNTYTSGPPASTPAITGNQPDWCMWGNVTSLVNYAEVNQLPMSLPLINYVTSTAPNSEDLYTFPALSVDPLHVWAVKVSAFVAKTDAGNRNIDLRTKSGATDDPGDNPNQATTASFQYLNSKWDHNPDTGLSWDYTTINAATSGVKVLS